MIRQRGWLDWGIALLLGAIALGAWMWLIIVAFHEDTDMNGVIDTIKQEEGFKDEPYYDSRGVLTIGYGTNISKITQAEAEMLLSERLDAAQDALYLALPWLRVETQNVRDALADMAYQLGVEGVLEFKEMLALIGEHKYEAAQKEALNSKWARETPERAQRVVARFTE